MIRSWRFGGDDRPVCGIGDLEAFLDGYEAAGGDRPGPERLMQDRPDAPELLEAVAAYLFAEVRGAVPREEHFRVLVAAKVCAVVAREIRFGAGPAREDIRLFADLLAEGDTESDGLDAEAAQEAARASAARLASAIRAGELDDRLEAVIDGLREHVARKLEVARPGYADG